MKSILLEILAFGAIVSSVLVITSKNPVISVLFLISVFINTAGYLIILGVTFVGIAYILVYIGAITVLFLFVIMMINIKLVDILEVGNEYTKNLPLAFSVGALFFFEIFSTLPFAVNNVKHHYEWLNVPLEILTSTNKLVLKDFFGANVPSMHINISSNPIIADTSFTNFLHIEMLGQGLYTYGALLLILSSLILLLSMIAPIILSTNVK